MGERHGVEFKRYDFSDPQSGKDVCDRRSASMKTHMRRWVNEGHNITTAEEMKIALESHEGVRRCRFAVVEINKSTQNSQVKKIPGISFLNNFNLCSLMMVFGHGKHIRLGKVIFICILPLQPMLKELQQ